MEFYYFKTSSSKKLPFVEYYENLGLKIKGLTKDEIPFLLEQRMLAEELAFLPFETSQFREEWKRISEEIERLGIKKAFSSSEIISKFLEKKEAFPELKVGKGEEGYIYFLYTFSPQKKRLGGVFSPHKRLTKRSPLKILDRKEDNILSSFVDEVAQKNSFKGIVLFRLQRKGETASLIEIDPLPDLSYPDKEAVKIASAFGYTYETLLNMLIKTLE